MIQYGISYEPVEMRGDGRLVNEEGRFGQEERWGMLTSDVHALTCHKDLIP